MINPHVMTNSELELHIKEYSGWCNTNEGNSSWSRFYKRLSRLVEEFTRRAKRNINK